MVLRINSWKTLLLLFTLHVILIVYPASSIPNFRIIFPDMTEESNFSVNSASTGVQKIFESVIDEDLNESGLFIGSILNWANMELQEPELEKKISEIFQIKTPQKIPSPAVYEKLQGVKNRINKLEEVLVPPEYSCDSLCEYAPHYPEKTMRQAFSEKNIVFDIESKDFTHKVYSDAPSVQNRNEFTSRPLCNSETIRLRPKIGRTKLGKLRYILSLNEHKPVVYQEICTEEGSNCLQASLTSEVVFFRLKCEQQYLYTKLDVLDPYTKKIVPELFKIRSGCCCRINSEY